MEGIARITVIGDFEGDYLVRDERKNGILEIVPIPAEPLPALVELTQTCSACPSQWEGRLDDGRWLYARYRGGYLRVGLGKDLDQAVRAYGEEALLERHEGDGFDGIMDTEELRRHLVGLIRFPDGLKVEGEPDWDAPVSFEWLEDLRRKRSSGTARDPETSGRHEDD